MTLNTEKLTQFAQAVGADVKEIKTTLASKADKTSWDHTAAVRHGYSRGQNSYFRRGCTRGVGYTQRNRRPYC